MRKIVNYDKNYNGTPMPLLHTPKCLWTHCSICSSYKICQHHFISTTLANMELVLSSDLRTLEISNILPMNIEDTDSQNCCV